MLVLRYVLLPFLIVGETYASNTGVFVLHTVVDGSCSKLRSADVSRVVTVAFVNRLVLNVIATVAIRLLSYYELPNTVYTCFQHCNPQFELNKN